MIEYFDDESRKLLSLISISSNGVTAPLETILRALSLLFIFVLYSGSLFIQFISTVSPYCLQLMKYCCLSYMLCMYPYVFTQNCGISLMLSLTANPFFRCDIYAGIEYKQPFLHYRAKLDELDIHCDCLAYNIEMEDEPSNQPNTRSNG